MAARLVARVGRAAPGRNPFAPGRIFGTARGTAKVAGAPFAKARLVAWTMARAHVSSLAGSTEGCRWPAGAADATEFDKANRNTNMSSIAPSISSPPTAIRAQEGVKRLMAARS